CSSVDENGTALYQTHPKTSAQLFDEYGGAYTRGISISSSSDVLLVSTSLEGIDSAHGTSIGVDLLSDTSDVDIKFTSIKGVRAAFAASEATFSSETELRKEYAGPTQLPLAVGFNLGPRTADVVFDSESSAENLSSPYRTATFRSYV
ncbi:unnamed protein product, partial [Chrysoparadoxa australica]